MNDDLPEIVTDETEDLTWDALDNYVSEIQRKLNKDALGAWRAGYDFLHVYVQAPTEVGDFTYRTKTNPSYTPFPPRTLGHGVWRLESSYDFRNLTIEEVKKNARQK